MTSLSFNDASHRLNVLASPLNALIKQEPDHDVRGMALPVLESVLEASREWLPASDPALKSIRDVMLVDLIASASSVRASDVLIIVRQMQAAFAAAREAQRGSRVHPPK